MIGERFTPAELSAACELDTDTDREVDSVVVDEGETDELASEVRIGLSAGAKGIRTAGPTRMRYIRVRQ